MSGKQHVTIGTSMAMILILCLIFFKLANVGPWMIILILGAILGSYTPDIDSKNSKATQYFNSCLCYGLIGLFVIKYFNINVSFITNFCNKWNINLNNLLPFIAILIFGKLSPHRMFTHKILGTCLFIISVYIIGNNSFTIGFVLGYILHILADKQSPNGKYLRFFEFKLPMHNSKNEFCI